MQLTFKNFIDPLETPASESSTSESSTAEPSTSESSTSESSTSESSTAEPSTSESSTSESSTAVQPAPPDPRLKNLFEAHGAILRRLERKQRELKRFNEEIEQLQVELAHRLTPLDDARQRLDSELHELFQSVLSRPNLGKRAKQEIQDLYLELQEWSALSPRTLGEVSFDPACDEPPEGAGGPDNEPWAAPRGSAPDAEHEQSEDHRGRQNSNLRATFIRLAKILHPDKVQDAAKRERYTALMKDLNRAYREGDAARILEIEASLAQADRHENEPEVDRRARVLENQIQMLQRQYSEVLHDLREARRAEPGEALKEVRWRRRHGAADVHLSLVRSFEDAVEELRKIHAHVELFATDKIKLDDFLAGPELAEDELGDLFGDLLGSIT